MVESRPVQPPGSAFVGRQREMAELRSALDDALSGQGRVVMLAVEFPFGHPLGLPGRAGMQTMVINYALKVLREAPGPNTIVHLEHA